MMREGEGNNEGLNPFLPMHDRGCRWPRRQAVREPRHDRRVVQEG
jgi:hypothetical protein